MKEKKQLLSLIIPCYNEEEALPLFYKEATKIINSLEYDTEMIFVDDGSKDQTANILLSLAEKDSKD